MNALLRLRMAGLGALSLAGVVIVSCSQSPTNKVTYVGNGMEKGEPPMCYQHRGEVRATSQMGTSTVWVHLNNTCKFPVDCNVFDDVTEQEHRLALPGYRGGSFLLGTTTNANSVDMKFDCTWSP
jgi:hypothetical protein